MEPVIYTPKHRRLFAGKTCDKCSKPPVWGIAKYITASGQVRYPWYCRQCGHMSNIYEPHHDHLIYTMVVTKADECQCERCGKMGAELHHWAPSAIFGPDADRWPVGFLCQPCHAEWHQLVTPGMRAQ
jgi:hypothetical protein